MPGDILHVSECSSSRQTSMCIQQTHSTLPQVLITLQIRAI